MQMYSDMRTDVFRGTGLSRLRLCTETWCSIEHVTRFHGFAITCGAKFARCRAIDARSGPLGLSGPSGPSGVLPGLAGSWRGLAGFLGSGGECQRECGPMGKKSADSVGGPLGGAWRVWRGLAVEGGNWCGHVFL